MRHKFTFEERRRGGREGGKTAGIRKQERALARYQKVAEVQGFNFALRLCFIERWMRGHNAAIRSKRMRAKKNAFVDNTYPVVEPAMRGRE